MAQTEHHDTFLSSAQLLERAVIRCREAEQGLRNYFGHAGELRLMEMKNIADQEHQLACALERFVETGPANVLNTRLQYQLDSRLLKKINSSSLDDAVDQLTLLNSDLVSTFQDQALKSGSPSVREAMQSICTEVNAINRRISMIRVTARDI